MEALRLDYETLVFLVLLGLASFVVGAFVLLISAYFRDRLFLLREKKAQADADLILAAVDAPKQSSLASLRKSENLKNMMTRMAANMEGEGREAFIRLYMRLDLYREDARLLHHGNNTERYQALLRMGRLQAPLPDEAWSFLLKDPNLEFRWAVMDYLIASKGKAALPWLMEFANAPGNRKKGILGHLLACFARLSPDALPLLLSHSSSDLLSEILLLTLANYPTPGAEKAIVTSFQTKSALPLLRAGLKAMIAHPSQECWEKWKDFFPSDDEECRVLIARGLSAYEYTDSFLQLEGMSMDASYPVRLESLQSLLRLKGASDFINLIATNSDHPCFELLQHLQQRRDAGSWGRSA